MRNHKVLPATDKFIDKWNEPYLPLLPATEHHRTLAVGLLISRPAEGRRLSWPGRMGEIVRWFDRPLQYAY